MADYRMPQLGADMKDGRVVEWFVQPGDRVHRGDVVGVVDTSKGAIEMEIWQDAVVAEIIAAPGTRVPVGEVLLRLEESAESPEAGPPAAAPEPVAAEAPAERPRTVPPPADRPASEAPRDMPEAAPSPAEPPPSDTPAPPPAPSAFPTVRASPAARARAAELGIDLGTLAGTGPDGAVVLADVVSAGEAEPRPVRPLHVTPVARKAAEVLNVDLTQVEGTGPDGVVTRADVEAQAEAQASTGPASAEPTPAVAEEPPGAAAAATGQAMREAIAAAMARSKREIPHYYLGTVADMDPAERWLAEENTRRPPASRVLSVALYLKAVALAVHDFPEMNGHWVDGRYHASQDVHVGVAISLRGGGLVAPAIRDADRRPVDELSAAVTDLVGRARSGRLRSSEMTSATITVSSLGDRGVETVYGVIYPPQVALVGVGRVTERPWAEDGLLGVRRVADLTLAGDHRASDGHRGGLFLRRVAALLATPEDLAAEQGKKDA